MSPGAVAFDLGAFLSRERGLVDAALEAALDDLTRTVPAHLEGPIRYAVLSGGKRLRPILCVCAYRAAGGGDDQGVYDVGAAIEFVHAYSLMHDDLPCMDDAPLRRGRPTPHRVYGEEAAMRAGATLIPAAALQAWRASRALGRSPSEAAGIVRELMVAAGGGGMVAGQVVDLLSEGRELSAEELDRLHRQKTGALLAASLRMGAMAAGASHEATVALGRCGQALGLAFQITDDVLDATATADQLGKNPSDAALAKSTYVGLYGAEEAALRARERVEEARSALEGADIHSPELAALATYVAGRRR